MSLKDMVDFVKPYVDPIADINIIIQEIVKNSEKEENINTVEDLIKKSKGDMLKVRNLGLKSIEEVVAKLQTYGLGLKNDEE